MIRKKIFLLIPCPPTSFGNLKKNRKPNQIFLFSQAFQGGYCNRSYIRLSHNAKIATLSKYTTKYVPAYIKSGTKYALKL